MHPKHWTMPATASASSLSNRVGTTVRLVMDVFFCAARIIACTSVLVHVDTVLCQLYPNSVYCESFRSKNSIT